MSIKGTVTVALADLEESVRKEIQSLRSANTRLTQQLVTCKAARARLEKERKALGEVNRLMEQLHDAMRNTGEIECRDFWDD